MPPRDSMQNTILVALVLCIVCSLAVSMAAVSLKDEQDENKALDVQKNILDATGLAQSELGVPAGSLSKDQVAKLFDRIETKMVDLETGEYIEASPEELAVFDPRQAARDPSQSKPIGDTEYPIGPSRRETKTKVYIVKSADGTVDQVVLPIYGNGLWSTLYGFLALDKDLESVKGITFYEHGETPGLGGEVDNPSWKSQWSGLSLYGDEGSPEIGVAKGPAPLNSDHLVDGLSGATITSRGVSNLVRYWVSEDGFKPFLKQLGSTMKSEGAKSGNG